MFKRIFGGLGGLLGKLPLINSILGIFGLKNLVLLGGLVGTFSVSYLSARHFINVVHGEYTNMQNKLVGLETELVEKDIESKKMQMTIVNLNNGLMTLYMNQQQVTAALSEVIKRERESSENMKKLEEKLFRENEGKKSLEELAVSKPEMVQKIINDELKRMKRCIQIYTGAEKEENEKINCDDIFGKSTD